MTAVAKPPAPMVSVYTGRTCIGFALNRGKLGFEAFDADQHSLGIYPTAQAAYEAISAKVAADAVMVGAA